MNFLLGTVRKGEEDAKKRVEGLKGRWPNNKFEVRPHETRHQIFVTDVSNDMPEATINQMRRQAQGTGTQPDVRIVEASKKVVQGVRSAPPAGGGGAAITPRT